MRQRIENRTYDEERALYNLQNADVVNCSFKGPADGESVLKEAGDIRVADCDFSLRYPLWHVRKFTLEHARMDEKTRAAIWYAEDGEIRDSVLNGIKCLRECDRITMERSTAVSPEFGWKCRGLTVRDSFVESEYLFLESRNVTLQNFRMKGKYSFQYMDGLLIEDSVLDTKDAFWHSRNVVVKNPKSGTVTADSVGEIIFEDATMDCTGKVVIRTE